MVWTNKRGAAQRPAYEASRAPLGRDDLVRDEPCSGGGLTIARQIIEGRPYLSVDDLIQGKGIEAKYLSEIRPLVTAR